MQQINIYLMEYGWFQVIGRMMVCLALVFMAYKDVREHKVSVIALIGCALITGIESGIWRQLVDVYSGRVSWNLEYA